MLTVRQIIILFSILPFVHVNNVAAEDYVQWQADGLAIKQPLNNLVGDANNGRRIVISEDKLSCLSCHKLPIPEEPFHGNIGPDLTHVASRLSEAEIRLRVVDEKVINPVTIMPGYYRAPRKLNQVAMEFENRTVLTAQEVEDVVAYLKTLK